MKIKMKIDKDSLRKKLAIKDGKDADSKVIVEEVLSKLDYTDAIKKEVKEAVANTSLPPRLAAKGIQLWVEGAKKLLTANLINIIGGTGVTVTYNYAQGRNDVTISASTGVQLLTVTGTIDDSNVAFTASGTPAVVIVNGASYRDGKGCSISGTAITLNNPVGTGGDIYALG